MYEPGAGCSADMKLIAPGDELFLDRKDSFASNVLQLCFQSEVSKQVECDNLANVLRVKTR